LHNYAFLEEPVRLIRATRLSARFHWPLEERTQARYDAAKENNYIEYLGKRMIGYEVEQVAHEDDPVHIMRALDKEGWLKLLHPHWTMAKIEASDVGQVVKVRQQMNELGYQVETGPIAMYFLTKKMGDKDISDIQRMIPRRDFVDKWKHLEAHAHDLAKKLTGKEASTTSGAWKILTHAAPENILFLTLTTRQQAVDHKIKNFFGKWRQVKEKLPFPEMAEMRITPLLSEYTERMEKAFLLLLDGKLRSHTEIVNFLKPYEPPPPPPPPAPKRGRGKAVAAAPPDGAAPVPAKRGRKPKGAAAPAAAPAEAPAQPVAEAAKPEVKHAAAAKSSPAKAGKKAATKVEKKAAPAEKKVARKTVPAKAAKRPVKVAKPAAKKAAPAKKAAKKAPAKKAKKR